MRSITTDRTAIVGAPHATVGGAAEDQVGIGELVVRFSPGTRPILYAGRRVTAACSRAMHAGQIAHRTARHVEPKRSGAVAMRSARTTRATASLAVMK